MGQLNIINPYSKAIIHSLTQTSLEGLQTTHAKLKKGQKSWQKIPLGNKQKIIRNFAEILQNKVDECAQIQTSETGKPIKQAKGEILASIERIKFFCDSVQQTIADQVVLDSPQWFEKITYEPLGVIANISAWNYPYFVGLNVITPALLTGNALFYKPSEYATLTGLKIAELLIEAGIPQDVIEVVIGDGAVGGQLCDLDINGVFFTGSQQTGQKILASQRDKLIRIGMELGGKDPIYVCNDVDPEKAGPSVADGAFYNAGQSCCSVERIYAHADIYDSLVKSISSFAEQCTLGDPMDEQTYIGPLTRSAQIETLHHHIEDAVQKGAKIEYQGDLTKLEQGFFPPTVLSQVNSDMLLMQDESFGPIIGIEKVRDDREAITKMNASTYGLTAGVFTANEARAQKIMAELEAGNVYWNACDRVSCRLPWTGWKNSGLGSTLSHLGISAFTRPKSWHFRKGL